MKKTIHKLLALCWLAFLLAAPLTTNAQSRLLDSLKNNVQLAIKANNQQAQAQALRDVATAQVDMGNIMEGLENGIRAKTLFESIGQTLEGYKTTSLLLRVHQQLGNGDKVLAYALPALAYARSIRDSSFIARVLNSVGAGQSMVNARQKAIGAYLEELKIEAAIGQETGQTDYNISSAYTEIGNYNEGIRHADLAIQKSNANGDSANLTNAYMAKVYALIHAGRVAEASTTFDIVQKWAGSTEEPEMLRDYTALSSWLSAAKGDYRQAYLQHQQFYSMDSTLSSQQRSTQFAEFETAYKTKEKEAENVKLQAKVARQSLWLGGILAALALLGFLIWSQRRQLKTTQQLRVTERQLADEQLARTQSELDFHKSELQLYTQSLREKTDAFEQLKTETSHILTLQNTEAERVSWLNQLTQSMILTEEQWRDFRSKFERVYPKFFAQIQATVPDATEAEKRLIALTKLDLTGNQIASMLGVSPDTVIKTRYRFRKKLEDGNLEGFLERL